MDVVYNYNLLRGMVRSRGMTLCQYAKAIGISNTSLHERLRSRVPFSQPEIERSVKVLSLDNADIVPLFFNSEIRKTVHNNTA